jgi:hypothetical protein
MCPAGIKMGDVVNVNLSADEEAEKEKLRMGVCCTHSVLLHSAGT